MHARMSVLQASPDRMDEALAFVRDTVVPRAQEAQGFGGIMTLVDRDTGELISISFWETPEDAEASRGLAQELRIKGAETFGAKIVSVKEYDVGHFLGVISS